MAVLAHALRANALNRFASITSQHRLSLAYQWNTPLRHVAARRRVLAVTSGGRHVARHHHTTATEVPVGTAA